MTRFNPHLLIASMDDDTFNKSKTVIKSIEKHFAGFSHNNIANHMAEILFKDNIYSCLGREEIGELLLTMFYKEFSDVNCAYDYLVWLKGAITDNRGRYQTDGRAKQYSDHFNNRLDLIKQDMKNKQEETEVIQNGLLETVIDCTYIALLLYQAKIRKPDGIACVSDIDDAIFPVICESMSEYHFRSDKEGRVVKADLGNEGKIFHHYLLKLLFLRICQDNGDESEVNE